MPSNKVFGDVAHDLDLFFEGQRPLESLNVIISSGGR